MSKNWDVIVVGAGSAGMPLAIKAAERGGKVLQVEADYRTGGTLHWSSGQIAGAGTRLQKSQGIDDSPDEHYADAQRVAHNTIDPTVLRLTVDNAAATIDWLMDLGFKPAPGTPVAGEAHEPYRTRRYLWGTEKAVSIYNVLKPVHDKLVRAGKIDLRTQHRLTQLVTDGKGAVTGVVCSTPNGEVQFSGKNIVLASGGYAANEKLWNELTPNFPLCAYTNPCSQGDGIVAARALGAVVDKGHMYLNTVSGFRENPADSQSGNFVLLTPGVRKVWEIFVDGTGKRFMQEDHPSIDYRERALLRQRGNEMFIVFDQGILTNAAPLVPEERSAYAARFGKHPNFLKGKSVTELAARMKVSTDTLRKTIADYNKAVDTGADKAFGKQFLIRRIEQPPFYALRTCGITVLSPAGLKVDKNLRVIAKNGKPIPNLYAAGEVLGFCRTSGDAFVGGLSLTPALTFGKLLGEKLLSW